MKYVIGTGWWCDETGKHGGSIQKHMKSSDVTRKKEFFKIWYYFVNKYTNPEKIVIIDSNSPVKPELPEDPRIEFISLRKNFGHFIESDKEKMCGVERAHFGGAFCAYINDCSFVYIEQDCLVKGEGWVERCMKEMKKGKIMYGDGKGTPQPQQQSLAIIKKDFIPVFISKLIEQFDISKRKMKEGEHYDLHSPEVRWDRAFRDDVDLLPFGYGRIRPINFDDKYFYAQHWTEKELIELLKRENILDKFNFLSLK